MKNPSSQGRNNIQFLEKIKKTAKWFNLLIKPKLSRIHKPNKNLGSKFGSGEKEIKEFN